MGPEWMIVIAARVLLPLTILRWPLLGAVIAFVADALDVVLLELLGVGDYSRYNEVDKALDTYTNPSGRCRIFGGALTLRGTPPGSPRSARVAELPNMRRGQPGLV